MYIQVTVDLHHYSMNQFDLRLSDQYSAKKFIDIVWQLKGISQTERRDGGWIRIQNKDRVIAGNEILGDSGVSSGDHLEIL